MEILFEYKKLARILNNERLIKGNYPQEIAKALKRKLGTLNAARTLADYRLTDVRLELLKDRTRRYSIRLSGNYRLIFTPALPVALKADGGIDEHAVEKIVVLDVVDYH